MKRGILYIVWGDKVEPLLQRSMASVRQIYPDMPIEVVRGEPDLVRGLAQKAKMATQSPFDSTLFLDADTVVLGNLDYAFDRGEEFGLACAICECPWLRRYGPEAGDQIEYNTGVLFFTAKSRPVFDTWQELSATAPSRSRWMTTEGQLRGLEYDDQSSFARAVRQCGFNPHVLPINYNFRPGFYRTFFSPMKIWHDPSDVPRNLAEVSAATESGKRLVQFLQFAVRT
jgi:hypothetical protein